MFDNIVFRDATKEDAEAIRDLLVESFGPYEDRYPPDAFKATVIPLPEIIDRLGTEDEWVYVLTDKDVVMGTTSLKLTEPENLYIYTMAISPEYRGKGIGRFLFDIVMSIAKEKNCTKISLETSNPLEGTLKYYERMGFKRTGNIRPYFGIFVFEMEMKIP